MKNKKGFTLIELLAVIVILAIIALIATPIILNMINDARKSAAVDSAYGYIESIEYANSMNMLDSEKYPKIESGSVSDINSKVNLKGTKPESGTVTIENGKVASATLVINGYEVKYDGQKATIDGEKTEEEQPEETKYAVYADGTAVYYNPTTGEKCTASDAVSTTGTKTGCMKFYTFNDAGEDSSEVNMILDHNTTALVAWNSSGNNADGMKEVQYELDKLKEELDWKKTPRLITADEVAEITGAKDALDWTSDKTYASTPVTGTSISYFYLDGADGTDTTWHTQVATTQGASKYAWLYDNTYGCTSYGCNISDDNKYEYGTAGSTNNVYGYWTSTPVVGNSGNAWGVNWDGGLGFNDVDYGSNYGVRPVITIDKSIIK